MHTIFIIEDHPAMREAYHELIDFEEDMTICCSVGSGAEAREHLPQYAPDLVLLDLSLPDVSGFDLLAEMQVASPSLPVLVVSGHHSAQYRERALRSGARGYVDKIDAADILVPTMRALLLSIDGKG